MKHEKKKRASWAHLALFSEEQNGVCAICGCRKQLVLDHDHKTGYTRGALCIACNSGLSFLEGLPETLERAFKYLDWAAKRQAFVTDVQGDYVPIWPIFIGDSIVDEYPKNYLLLDQFGQKAGFVHFQLAYSGYATDSEIEHVIEETREKEGHCKS